MGRPKKEVGIAKAQPKAVWKNKLDYVLKSRQPIQQAVNAYLANRTDQNAENVVQKCETLLYWYIHHLRANVSVNEDILQETRLAMWRILQNYEQDKALFTTYLHKTILGVIQKFTKESGEYRFQEGTELTPSVDKEIDPWEKIELSLDIQNAINILDTLSQDVIYLIYIHGLSLDEVAYRLECDKTLVRTLHHSALLTLHTLLRQTRKN